MPKLKFADDLPQRASVNAPLQCQICFESPAETTAKAPPEEPSLFDECGDTNERNPQASPSSRPIALRQKRLCPITAGSAIHLKKSGKHLSSSIEATAISVQALCSACRLIPYATGTASIRRIDSCRAAAPWTRNRSGKKLPMKTDGASAQELPSGLHKKHCQHSADDRANNLGAVLKH